MSRENFVSSTRRAAAPPAHAALASFPETLAEDVASERERLRAFVTDCALNLLEQNWRAAARSAYSAAWSFHRLPAKEQAAFIVSEYHDDDGPMPVSDDWSASAFAAWLVYRCNRSIEGLRRTTPVPRFDANGRKIEAVDEPQRANESIITRPNAQRVATLDFAQKGMF